MDGCVRKGSVGDFTMSDLARMLKDTEVEISRLRKDQVTMNLNFEGSRKDLLKLQVIILYQHLRHGWEILKFLKEKPLGLELGIESDSKILLLILQFF